MVNLTIDGKQVTVSKTATIYEAAKEAGIHIPVLCYAKKLLPYGACRVCLVEVERYRGEPPPVTAFDPPQILRRDVDRGA